MTPASLADSALAYVDRSIAVFPLREREKDPVVRNGFKKAVADRDQVARWWRGGPNRNIGIATGAPAGFWVLDLDGPEAEAAIAALEAQHGPLPATVEQATGKGRHLCFAWDPAAREIRNRSRLFKTPIDVRGAGGYIVAPPSIHPSGRRYAWTPGRSPWEIAFAAAPAWLVELVLPAEPVATPVAAPTRRDGRASRFGEVVLDRACDTIRSARVGARDSTLYRTACSVGGLVASGHIEAAYARDTLLAVGRVHVPSAMNEGQLLRQVDRALEWAASRPWGPDENARWRPSVRRERRPETPVETAKALGEAGQAWAATRAVPPPAAWFERLGLDPGGLPAGGVRSLDGRGALALGPGPGGSGPGGPVDGVLLVLRDGRQELIGESMGRVAVVAWPEGADQILVATHFADAWALGAAALEGGEAMAVVVAPRLATFAGAPLGDRYGRSEAETPRLDPEHPPWTWPGMAQVWLAVRHDLRGPVLAQRRPQGGTVRRRLEGQQAWRFWGGLAEAGWRAAGAKAVKVLAPPIGRQGFSDVSGARA